MYRYSGISATRLSQGDPVGFPSHSREWFGIFVYHTPCLFSSPTVHMAHALQSKDLRDRNVSSQYRYNASSVLRSTNSKRCPVKVNSILKADSRTMEEASARISYLLLYKILAICQ